MSISDAGLSHLRQIFYLKDMLDWELYLEQGIPGQQPPLDKEIADLINQDKDFATPAKKLVDEFNKNCRADVLKVAELLQKEYGLAVDPKANIFQYFFKVLDNKRSHKDLDNLLSKLAKVRLSEKGRRILSQALYILDTLLYDQYLTMGDGKFAAPLAPETVAIWDDPVKGGYAPAIQGLMAKLGPKDKNELRQILGIPTAETNPFRYVSDKFLAKKDSSEDVSDLMALIERRIVPSVPSAEIPAYTPESLEKDLKKVQETYRIAAGYFIELVSVGSANSKVVPILQEAIREFENFLPDLRDPIPLAAWSNKKQTDLLTLLGKLDEAVIKGREEKELFSVLAHDKKAKVVAGKASAEVKGGQEPTPDMQKAMEIVVDTVFADPAIRQLRDFIVFRSGPKQPKKLLRLQFLVSYMPDQNNPLEVSLDVKRASVNVDLKQVDRLIQLINRRKFTFPKFAKESFNYVKVPIEMVGAIFFSQPFSYDFE